MDVDGVLLNWLDGFESFLLAQAPDLHKDFSALDDAENLESLLGMTSEQMHEWIDRFHHHTQFAQLKPLPGAVKALQILEPWCNLVCITASGTSPDSQKLRHTNLRNVFGDVFEQVWCVDRSVDKPEYLLMYDAGYWVEDQLKNALMGVNAGHMSFLMDAPYNMHTHDPQVIKVNNMLEVGEIILSQLRSNYQ